MVDFQSRDTQRGRDEEPAAAESGDRDDADDDGSAPERGIAVVSIGGGRTIEDDEAGDAVVETVDAAGEAVVTRELIDASFDGVQTTVDALVDRRDVYGVVTTGSTGVEPDDVTIEAVEPMLDKELPGFGELVRRSCYEAAGSAVIRTRTTAGVLDGVACFCLPGDADVVRRSVRDIVVPEAETLAALAAEPES